MDLLKIPGIKNNTIVPSLEIVRIEAVSNYSRIYFADGQKILSSKVLQWFEDRLPGSGFARVHRSHLINKLFIYKIHDNNPYLLVLTSGELIGISRRRRPAVKELMT